MSRFPIRTQMPGLSRVQVTLNDRSSPIGIGQIVDKLGKQWSFGYDLDQTGLFMKIDDLTICSFAPWPEYPEFWSASGLMVDAGRKGLASAFFIGAQQIITLVGGKHISPSDNVTQDGRGMWKKLDPSIEWEWVAGSGSYRLDLTGRLPPNR